MINLFQEEADLLADWLLDQDNAPPQLQYLARLMTENNSITIEIDDDSIEHDEY